MNDPTRLEPQDIAEEHVSRHVISRQVDEIFAEWILPVRPLSLGNFEPLENRIRESLNPAVAP